MIAILISVGIASAANSAAVQMTPTPAPTSTYIQFHDPLPFMTATPGLDIYEPQPTPVPFEGMLLLYYYYDAERNVDCWVTSNYMAVSCLRRPAHWPCEGKARNDY
jgi:hypothetical protein